MSKTLQWYRSFVGRAAQYRGWSGQALDDEANRLYAQHVEDEAARELRRKTTDLDDDDLAAALETSYRESFAFESPADEAQLRSIIAVECELVKITRALGTKQTDR